MLVFTPHLPFQLYPNGLFESDKQPLGVLTTEINRTTPKGAVAHDPSKSALYALCVARSDDATRVQKNLEEFYQVLGAMGGVPGPPEEDPLEFGRAIYLMQYWARR